MAAIRDRVFGVETGEVDHYPALSCRIMPLGKMAMPWHVWWRSKPCPSWYLDPLDGTGRGL